MIELVEQAIDQLDSPTPQKLPLNAEDKLYLSKTLLMLVIFRKMPVTLLLTAKIMKSARKPIMSHKVFHL
jgi:hypothetical protein